MDGETFKLDHGHVVIAAITSCTNTSNPSVMLGAGLLARNAVARGLTRQPWVKTSLAPGLEGRDRVPRPRRADRAARGARLQPRRLRLHDVHRQLRAAARRDLAPRSTRRDLAVCSVLSGNRNFEGRINPDVKMNYLASPPLVVAYALAGTMDIDLVDDPLGDRRRRRARSTSSDIWPSTQGGRADRRGGRAVGHVPQELRRGLRRRRALERPRGPDRRPLRVGRASRPTCASRRTSRACRPSPSPSRTSRARACWPSSATASPPTTSRPPARSRRTAPPARYLHGARRRAARLQLLRLAARQPRGDDARHVRQHPPAQPARAGHRGRRDRTKDGEEMSIYDAAMAYARGGHAAGRPRRQGVRLGLVARLGGQGHEPARRPGGDRRVLRAHPPLEPRRDGRAAAAVPRRRVGRVAGAHRRGGVHDHRPGRAAERRRAAARRSRCGPATRSSRRACASTRPRRRTTSATAGSCSTSCAR